MLCAPPAFRSIHGPFPQLRRTLLLRRSRPDFLRPVPGPAQRLLRRRRVRHGQAARHQGGSHRQSARLARAHPAHRAQPAGRLPVGLPAGYHPGLAGSRLGRRTGLRPPARTAAGHPRHPVAGTGTRHRLLHRVLHHFLPAHRGRRAGAQVLGDPQARAAVAVDGRTAVSLLLADVSGDLPAQRQRQCHPAHRRPGRARCRSRASLQPRRAQADPAFQPRARPQRPADPGAGLGGGDERAGSRRLGQFPRGPAATRVWRAAGGNPRGDPPPQVQPLSGL